MREEYRLWPYTTIYIREGFYVLFMEKSGTTNKNVQARPDLCEGVTRGNHEKVTAEGRNPQLTAFAMDSYLLALKEKMTPREVVATISSLDHLLRTLTIKLKDAAMRIAPDLNHIEYVEGSKLLNEISEMSFLRDSKLVRIDYHDNGVTLSACDEIPEPEELPCGLGAFLEHEGVLAETIGDLLESDMLIALIWLPSSMEYRCSSRRVSRP